MGKCHSKRADAAPVGFKALANLCSKKGGPCGGLFPRGYELTIGETLLFAPFTVNWASAPRGWNATRCTDRVRTGEPLKLVGAGVLGPAGGLQ